ncbi:MAG: cytochrome c [Phreatobacter sp.]|uniref:c-type cytochrome n=1 Tax=Phreatobacter sp. TaxID=1966341 RepID=UPI002734CE2B|nr:cytochrome c [Phreatobacter sp.]MDP2804038.1 cytochrome c [Phreatobacter sp.]
MKRLIIAAAAIAIGTLAVSAQGADPIAARKASMKAVGEQTGAGARMARGQAPFDLAQARAIFAAYEQSAATYANFFPEGSQTGGETAALPTIWANRAAFNAAVVKWGADARTEGAKVTDLATFQAAFGEVAKNCGTCHETYRARRN